GYHLCGVEDQDLVLLGPLFQQVEHVTYAQQGVAPLLVLGPRVNLEVAGDEIGAIPVVTAAVKGKVDQDRLLLEAVLEGVLQPLRDVEHVRLAAAEQAPVPPEDRALLLREFFQVLQALPAIKVERHTRVVDIVGSGQQEEGG